MTAARGPKGSPASDLIFAAGRDTQAIAFRGDTPVAVMRAELAVNPYHPRGRNGENLAPLFDRPLESSRESAAFLTFIFFKLRSRQGRSPATSIFSCSIFRLWCLKENVPALKNEGTEPSEAFIISKSSCFFSFVSFLYQYDSAKISGEHVGNKVNRISNPHRIRIIAVCPRQFLDRIIRKIKDRNRIRPTASIMPPKTYLIKYRNKHKRKFLISQFIPIRRK